MMTFNKLKTKIDTILELHPEWGERDCFIITHDKSGWSNSIILDNICMPPVSMDLTKIDTIRSSQLIIGTMNEKTD